VQVNCFLQAILELDRKSEKSFFAAFDLFFQFARLS